MIIILSNLLKPEMEELQKDACDAGALVISILIRTIEEKQDSKIICHDSVRCYCLSASRAASRIEHVTLRDVIELETKPDKRWRRCNMMSKLHNSTIGN